jgi:tRNA pseudouridine55 synthase
VVKAVMKALGVKKAGHAGTLDPAATGLLLVLVGKATALSGFLAGFDKVYSGTVELGLATDTLDAEGKILADARSLAPESIEPVLLAAEKFLGPTLQVPPNVSAISVLGVRSHARARAGETFALPPRKVVLKSLDLLKYEPPVLSFRALVSKGFYVRSLARDLGLSLGLPGGTLSSLRRESSGPFPASEAVRSPFDRDDLLNRLVSPRDALPHFPECLLDDYGTGEIANGRPLRACDLDPGNFVPPLFPPPEPAKSPSPDPTNAFSPFPAFASGTPIKLVGPEGDLVALGKLETPGTPEKVFSSPADPPGPRNRAPEGPFLRPFRVFGTPSGVRQKPPKTAGRE